MRKNEEVEDIPWDKKKVVIGVLIVLVVIFALLYFKERFLPTKQTDVKGTMAENKISTQSLPDPAQKIHQNIDQIKQNVSTLNVVDVATSSPQVQKVLSDIKNLENYPKNQARQACEKICAGL